jgi:hypothetical protein
MVPLPTDPDPDEIDDELDDLDIVGHPMAQTVGHVTIPLLTDEPAVLWKGATV